MIGREGQQRIERSTKRRTEDVGSVVGVEQADNVDAEVTLKPDDVGGRSMEYL